jgi:hypothetical protein
MNSAARCLTTVDRYTFLHVFPDNPAASLYARLGFSERARPWVIWRRPFPAAQGAAP